MRSPVRQEPLVIQVTAQFRELIDSGQWPVGQRIPGEHELTEQLGVSRATVREALRGLSITGLLEPRIGDGTYVRATNEITGVLVRDHTTTALNDILDARAGLEAASARLAASRDDSETEAELRSALLQRNTTRDTGDPIAYAIADAAFHRAVVAASHNPLLIRLHAAVAEVITQSIQHTTVFPEPFSVGELHAQLVEHICAHDAEAASRTSYALIDAVKTAVSSGH